MDPSAHALCTSANFKVVSKNHNCWLIELGKQTWTELSEVRWIYRGEENFTYDSQAIKNE